MAKVPNYTKKHLKIKKSRARLCLSFAWIHINKKKNIKNAIMSMQELIKLEKWLVFGTNLTLILPIFGERKKVKLYILKR